MKNETLLDYIKEFNDSVEVDFRITDAEISEINDKKDNFFELTKARIESIIAVEKLTYALNNYNNIFEMYEKKMKKGEKNKSKELYIELIKARNEINIAWIKLDYAVANYNMIEKQIRIELGLDSDNKLNKKKNERKRK